MISDRRSPKYDLEYFALHLPPREKGFPQISQTKQHADLAETILYRASRLTLFHCGHRPCLRPCAQPFTQEPLCLCADASFSDYGFANYALRISFSHQHISTLAHCISPCHCPASLRATITKIHIKQNSPSVAARGVSYRWIDCRQELTFRTAFHFLFQVCQNTQVT